MICKTCGRNTLNEEANFCEYCGSSFREMRNQTMNSAPQEPYYGQRPEQISGQMPGQMPEQIPGSMQMNFPGMMAGQINSETLNNKQMSFADWLLTYGILFGLALIPILGFFMPFVMLCIWACKKNTPVSKKNWARVTLIFIAVLFIIYYIVIMYTPIGNELLQYINNMGVSGTKL